MPVRQRVRLTVEEGVALVIPHRAARGLHQLFREHRIRKPAGALMSRHQGRGHGDLIGQFFGDPVARLIRGADDSLEFVDRGLRSDRRSTRAPTRPKTRIDARGSNVERLLIASPCRSQAAPRARRQPTAIDRRRTSRPLRQTGTASAAVRRGGPRRQFERARERGLDGVANVVASGGCVRAEQKPQRRGCRRFVARQRVEHGDGHLLHSASNHIVVQDRQL